MYLYVLLGLVIYELDPPELSPKFSTRLRPGIGFPVLRGWPAKTISLSEELGETELVGKFIDNILYECILQGRKHQLVLICEAENLGDVPVQC